MLSGERNSSVTRLAKLKTCRVCPTQFRPRSSTQIVCSVPCAREWTRRQEARKAERQAREEKRERRERLKEIRPLRDWIKLAQAAFNGYIRARDEGKPCISCGVTNPPERYGGAWDAGHYRTRGAAPELRFEELNCHRQCKSCNTGEKHNSGKAETVRAEYRRRLIERIGLEKVEWLEGNHAAKHYTADELEEVARVYRAKTRELRKARGQC